MMKRWQWWLVGLALMGAAVALLIVFWPKVVESLERCCASRRGIADEPAELEEAEVAG